MQVFHSFSVNYKSRNPLFSLAIILLFIIQLHAETRGMTSREFDCSGAVVGKLQPVSHSVINQQLTAETTFDREEWYPVDSLHINLLLDAGKTIGLEFNYVNQTVQPITNMNPLSSAAELAVNKSPLWIQPRLRQVFYQMVEYDQNTWAAVINNAVDPFVDEIAFSIATSSSVYLTSIYANPQMMLQNAEQMYFIDEQLPYVQINNYGNSVTGGDYYSTTSYHKINAEGQTVEVEVPRDIYYWYIVHPKLSDEIPAYIDPDVVESNTTHANNIADPPTGQFWRSFFFNAQEGTYPVLSDTLSECATLFNRDGTPGDAIKAVQWWINSTMGFTSNSERPHQPVRIYRKHIGRCGEYQDYTAAAARTALIPCTSIMSISTDHVWNEFWEDGWVQWEPVNGYINTPLVYENGWGKVFGTVFEARSDGFATSVTERYSEGLATINLAVTDSLGMPVDGARVILAIYDAGLKFDMLTYTDNQGNCTFTVGENRQYYVRLESPVGLFPPNAGTYVLCVDNSVAGEIYNFEIEIPRAAALPDITEIAPPVDNVMDWSIWVTLNAEKQVLAGTVMWDDIDITGTAPKCYNEINLPSTVNMLMTDADNYMNYLVSQTCSASHVLENIHTGGMYIPIPADQPWYVFLDNGCRIANSVYLTGGLLYEHYGVANEDEVIPEAGLRLFPGSPNPFSQSTGIRFSLTKDSRINVSVYNVKGQKVKELANSILKSGYNSINWDGTDSENKPVCNGVYFYKVMTQVKTLTGKLLHIR
jgi:hypothetical protein